MPTHADRIENMLKSVATKRFQENAWGARHCAAWREPQPVEAGMVRMIEGAAAYADHHARRFGSKIGDDGVLGPHWAGIVRDLLGLLNGELGRLDGGTCDGLLRSMLTAEGIAEE